MVDGKHCDFDEFYDELIGDLVHQIAVQGAYIAHRASDNDRTIPFDNEPLAVHWSVDKIGFGMFTFYVDSETGKIRCDNETMSKRFIRRVLLNMVDDCELDT